jgi:membrane protease subunit HflC
MKNALTLTVAVVVVIVLFVYAFIYQVRYDEVAVITTFDKAREPDPSVPGDKGSLVDEPGPGFKMLWPVQKVYKYTTRVQLLEDQLEEVQTDDKKTVVMQTYVAWRIHDPLKFFVKLENVPNAEKSLKPLMSDFKGVISGYRFDQLVNTDPQQLKLEEIEKQAMTVLQKRIDDQSYGITVERVGIRRIVLPESVTEKVFETMKKTRERLAEKAKSEGAAQAASIKAEARTAQQRILAFAERRAQAIRAMGDQEAAEYYKSFAKDEQFAIFLRKVEALKQMLKKNTTLVLDANDITPLDLFVREPGEKTAAK